MLLLDLHILKTHAYPSRYASAKKSCQGLQEFPLDDCIDEVSMCGWCQHNLLCVMQFTYSHAYGATPANTLLPDLVNKSCLMIAGCSMKVRCLYKVGRIPHFRAPHLHTSTKSLRRATIWAPGYKNTQGRYCWVIMHRNQYVEWKSGSKCSLSVLLTQSRW
jgi:hypothetical protein